MSLTLALILIAAAFVVGYFVGANNPLSSVKKKIADEAKGILKKLPAVLVPLVLLMPSCRTNDSKILHTAYDTSGFHTVNDHSKIGEIRQPGDTIWAHTVPTIDTVYHVQANTAEQWHYAVVHGNIWWMLLGFAILVAGAWWFVRANNGNQNGKDAGPGTVAVVVIILAVAAGVIGTNLNWWAGYSADIDKPTYDQQMQQYGNLNAWFHNRLK